MAAETKKDISTIALWVALGFALGGVLLVPLSKLWLPGAFQTSFETNGQFGDFVGGLLNPVIALLAFTWLRKGVIAQENELRETKKALEASAAAQEKQVQITAVSALFQNALLITDHSRRNIDALRLTIEKVENDHKNRPMDVRMNEAIYKTQSQFDKKIIELKQVQKMENERLVEVLAQQEIYAETLKTMAPSFVT